MTREEFLRAAEAHYEEINALNKLDNFYDYEKEFVSIWQGLGKEVLEKNLAAIPLDKRKKKPYNFRVGDNK